jgi:type II secretory pathway component PulM
MTNTLKQEKRRLQAIIDNNNDDAENGSASAQMQVISAQADLDRIAQSELAQYIASTPLPKPLILVD